MGIVCFGYVGVSLSNVVIGVDMKFFVNSKSLESRKNDSEQTEFHDVSFNELNDTANIRFVESWRWIPITEASFNKLSHNILCLKKNGKINSLAIITESKSFRDTIILTINYGSYDDIKKIILNNQNTSFTKNYSKIRILTEKENLMISITGYKFPFYLVEKIL